MMRVWRIAREEWRSLARNRAAVFGLVLLVALTLLATLTAYEQQRAANTERARYQAQAQQEFEAQPDRHPHRMVHYGHFVFRPVNPMAAFDPGIEGYTGNTLYLEGHRQNTANFGDVRQTSLLLRFGQLTPAFVLQVMAPLLLIFFGYVAVARERESGTLRILLAQGVTSRQLVGGKLVALCGFAAMTILPALISLAWLALSKQVNPQSALVMAAGYTMWLLIWAFVVVLMSSSFARGRDALLALLAVWAVTVILVPRAAPDLANNQLSLTTRFEDAINVQRDYLALGDAHDPNDPKFAAFRDALLKQYGVTRVEDLPVNFKGLVGIEGERKSTELFNRYAANSFDTQTRQNAIVDGFGWVSPILALRRLSMTSAGTDLASFRSFLEQGEQYRYDLIQRLNRLQADKVSYADDTTAGKENRISHQFWQQTPAFQYRPPSTREMLERAAPAGAVLFVWLVAVALVMWSLSGRIERKVR